MATKAQKRARAQAKHEAFMEEIRLSGLEALRKDREYRRKKLLRDWQENHDKNHSWKKLVEECPHCQNMKKNAAELSKNDNILADAHIDNNIKESI